MELIKYNQGYKCNTQRTYAVTYIKCVDRSMGTFSIHKLHVPVLLSARNTS